MYALRERRVHVTQEDFEMAVTKVGFCAKLGPCRKSRSLQGLLESAKKNRGSHAFFRYN